MRLWRADQMGVELGKVLAKNILAQLEKPDDVKGHDSSVCALSVCSLPTYSHGVPRPDHWPHPLLPEDPQGVTALYRRGGEVLMPLLRNSKKDKGDRERYKPNCTVYGREMITKLKVYYRPHIQIDVWLAHAVPSAEGEFISSAARVNTIQRESVATQIREMHLVSTSSCARITAVRRSLRVADQRRSNAE